MYKVGDKVVYPHHGAGTVVKREKREVLGEKREYLTIKILHNDMTVNVPADNAERVGLRKVIENDEIKKVVKYLTSGGTEMPKNWNRRFKHNRDKMKTGDIFELAEVVCNLALRDTDKGLSTGEKQMYVKAKKILASELMYAKQMSEEDAAEWLDGVLAGVEEKPDAKAADPQAVAPKAAARSRAAAPGSATARSATARSATARSASASPAVSRKTVAAKAAPARKPAARSSAAKAAPKQAAPKKTAPKKAAPTKPAAKKAAPKRAGAGAAPKQSAPKKTAPKKTAPKKTAAKTSGARPAKSAAKKTAGAKPPAAKKRAAAAR